MQRALHVHYYMPFLSCDDPNYHAFVSAVHQYLLSYNVFSFSTTIEGALINKHTVDFALDFLRKEEKTCNFNDFKKYWDSLQKTDQINVLRIVFNGKSDLLKTWKELSKGIAADKKLILEKAMIGGKTSGWVSDYLDTFFQSVFQIEGAFSEKAFRKYLENEDHLKSTLREFENNFPELYSLIERLCDIICE